MRRQLVIWACLVLPVQAQTGEPRVRLGVQQGHRLGAISVAISSDGRWGLTAGLGESAALVWDLQTGHEVWRLEGHTKNVAGVAITPDGRWGLTGSDDRTARLWDLGTGREVRRLESHADMVSSVAITADGQRALTGSWDKTARLWDLQSGRELKRLEHGDTVRAVAMTPDGRWAVTGGMDAIARVWDLESGLPVQVLKGHEKAVSTVAISPDGRWALTGSWDRTTRLWDLRTGREVQRMEGSSQGSVAISADARWALIDGETPLLWDVQARREGRRLEARSAPLGSVSMTPDGRRALTIAEDRSVRLWDLQTGKELHRMEGLAEEPTSVAVTPDGRWALAAGAGKGAWLWDLKSGREVRTIGGSKPVAMTPDGHWALTGGSDTRARLWDLQTGREVRQLQGDPSGVSSVALTPDGHWALIGSSNDTRLWDLQTGSEVRRLERNNGSVAISADGHLGLTANPFDRTARLWDLQTGAEVRRLAGHRGSVNAVAITPDGRWAVTGSSDTTARIWDLENGSEKWVLEGHKGAVDSVAISTDGRWAETSGHDDTARLWDLLTGQEVQSREVQRMRLLQLSIGEVALTDGGRYSLATDLCSTRFWSKAGNQSLRLYSFRDGSWAVVDDEGRYDASDPDDSSALYWLQGNEVIELRQLEARFYTPGLLARFWNGERLPSVVGIQRIPLPPAVDAQLPNGSGGLLNVRLANRGGGIGQVVVRVNGRELGEPLRQKLDPQASTAAVAVPLDRAALRADGNNEIEVIAYDADGLVSSRGAVLAYKTDPQSTRPQMFYAIIAGSSKYAGPPEMNLKYAAKDARDIADALRIGAVGMLGPERVWMRVLTSGLDGEAPPDKSHLKAAFQEVAKVAQAGDVLVVYLAGHGTSFPGEQEQYYYFTSEARSLEIGRDKALRDLSTVSSAELKEWLNLPGMPLKQVLILDTCVAGAAADELANRRELSPDQVRAIDALKHATGSFILMGSDAASFESARFGQGLLTYALLEYLRSGQLDAGGKVDVANWFSYAESRVPDLAREIRQEQYPKVSRPARGNTFPVALFKTEEERRRIRLAQSKPQLLQAQCLTTDLLDPLRMAGLVRDALRATSEDPDSPIEYLNQTSNGVPGAYVPRIGYNVQGNIVTAQIRLVRDESVVTVDQISGSQTDLPGLVRKIVERILENARNLR